jgi:hypothetical protein
MFSIIHNFNEDQPLKEASVRIRQNIQRLQKVFLEPPDEVPTESSSILVSRPRIPRVNSMLNGTDPNNLYGISFRTVAMESLLMLGEALKVVKPHITATVPKAKEKSLIDFYANSVDIIPELVKYIEKSIFIRFINVRSFVGILANFDSGIMHSG